MRKFETGDKAIYRGETVIIGRNRKTNAYRQTYYFVRPAGKKSGGSYVRSDYLEAM